MCLCFLFSTSYVSTVTFAVENSIDEIVDIEQEVHDRGFPVRYAFDGDWGAAQSFIPVHGVITAADIYLRKFGFPEFNLIVELHRDSPDGMLIDSEVFVTSEIQATWDWIYVDFSDVIVEPGVVYYIVVPSPPEGMTTTYGYEWGYAFGNQYDDGSFWFTRDGGGLWRDLPSSYEFTFRTYWG